MLVRARVTTCGPRALLSLRFRLMPTVGECLDMLRDLENGWAGSKLRRK